MFDKICSQCNTPNRATAKFCSSCGALLLRIPSDPTVRAYAPPVSKTGKVLQNRYRIEEELGRGGFGAVYNAWDLNLNRRCAVKENLGVSKDARRQFAREASVLANLSHPNLPRVIDHFVIPGQGQYLVMDYIEGEDLESLLARKGTLPTDQALEWAAQVAGALDYLHRRVPPVFHRDIKPSNIRLTPNGQAILVDFGLVKASDPYMKTTIGARAVTPGYAPPEQYGRGITDARTDIYALGATLYTMVTGREPLESVQRISGGKNPPAHQVNPLVPVSIENLIDRAMALEPQNRYQSAEELRQALSTLMISPFPSGVARTVVVEPIPPTQVQPVARGPIEPFSQAIPNIPIARRPVTRTSKRLIGIAVMLISAACILGGIGLTTWILFRNQVSTRTTATAERWNTLVAQERGTSTAQTMQTATAQSQATSTAVVRITITAAANATFTAHARATNDFPATMVAGAAPIFGPREGSLFHDTDDSIETSSASVNLDNFLVEAWFINPFPASQGSWDYGFIFRYINGYNNIRLGASSDKKWILTVITGNSEGYDFQHLARGSLTNFDVSPSGMNKLALMVQGGRGWFYVNNDFVTELDLSGQMQTGDVLLATGLTIGNEINGEVTRFQGFTIWPVP